MPSSNKKKFATQAIHAGQSPEPITKALMTPVFFNSTYQQSEPGIFYDGYDYSRTKNPTRTAYEANLATLENGKFGISFASGSAATCAALHLLQTGDHVILSDDVYGGTFRIFNAIFKQFGINFSMIDLTKPEQLDSVITKNTKMIWLETPSNPLLKIIDIKKVTEIAHARNSLVVVDNTFASPYLQRPLEFAADIVCISSTKYIGGHSDLIGGALVVNSEELADKIYYIQNAVGAVPSPMDCFLFLRSTKTIHVRMQRHCENATKIAKFLDGHKKIKRVIYPGLSSHPQHEIAKKQMHDFGGMISIELDTDLGGTKKFLSKLELFTLAESLGGVESLIEHPAMMTHASIPVEQRAAIGISDSLVRISVGIEDVEDLIEDLEKGLA